MKKVGMDAVFVEELNMWVSINMYRSELSDARDVRAIDVEGFESRQLYRAKNSLADFLCFACDSFVTLLHGLCVFEELRHHEDSSMMRYCDGLQSSLSAVPSFFL
jgi:hypothetical protein